MADLLSFAAVAFSAIFFVVDPFAVIPLFLSITQGDDARKRHATALKAALVTTVTLLAFATLGDLVFRLFGITIGAFKIAGGILLFLLALDMVRAQRSRIRTTPQEEMEGVEKDDVAIIPLGIPMLAGPGSMATVTVLMSQTQHSPAKIAVVVACIIVTGLLTFLLLRGAFVLETALKQTGLNIMNRIMGLVLAAVAVQFVVSGAQDLLPGLASAWRGAAPSG